MKKLVLIIEDEEKMVRILESRIARGGFNIEVARNGQEALDFCLKQKPDFVLLDLLLPGLSGMDFLRRIREIYDQDKLPILVLTNLVDDRLMRESRELGAVNYFVKSNTKLVDIVEIIKKYFKDERKNKK